MKRTIGLAIGTRYIFGKNGRLLVRFFPPIFAIAIGVMTIVTVFNVSNGMIRGIITKFIETGIYHIRANTDQVYGADELRSAQQELLSDPLIEQVGFEYNSIALLSAGNLRQGVTIRALSKEVWQDDPLFQEHITVEQGVLRLSDATDIMIGSHLAQQMQIQVGDTVRLISFNRVRDTVVPRISSYQVQGIFSAGYRDLDRTWVFLPFEHARQSLAVSTLRTVVGIKIANPFSLSNPIIRSGDRARAQRIVRSAAQQLPDDFDVQTWFEFRAEQFLAFRSTKNILLFIMLLIVAVAMIHLVSTLNTLVVEKHEEIAYLKCIGVSNGYVRTIFITCGFYIGLSGVLVGVLLGLLASIHINRILRTVETVLSAVQRLVNAQHGISLELLRTEFYLEQIPITLSLSGILSIFFVTLLLAVLAALLPAQSSTKITPMQLLSDTHR